MIVIRSWLSGRAMYTYQEVGRRLMAAVQLIWEDTMNFKVTAALALGLSAAWTTGALAQESVKIGLILPYSGPFADAANQLDAGVKLYMEKHGDEVAGKKIEIIRKDTGGPNADVARRLAQELVVRDGADIIAGFALTPEAIGASEVATEAKKLTVLMNAATSSIINLSPYMVRTSVTIPQVNYALGKWAVEEGGVTQ